MLIVMKSARDMLMKMSYKGFEIKDDKDLLKCLFAIISDYLGSIFHDKDNQQETIFHHLAQSIPYNLDSKSKQKCPERNDNLDPNGEEPVEKFQSSGSTVKLLESENNQSLEATFEKLAISFDLTSLSYNCSLNDNFNHVLFLETQTVYPLFADILCKYIYYRTNHVVNNLESGLSSTYSSIESDSKPSQNATDDCIDRIAIHLFPEAIDEPNTSCVSSLAVSNDGSSLESSSSQSLLRCLTIPKSILNVGTGQKYCFLYFDSKNSVLGQSRPFEFSSQPSNQIKELDIVTDSDDDGFIIVES